MFLIFWALSTSTGKGQEHAPLLATCEADVALWFNESGYIDYLNQQTQFSRDGTPKREADEKTALLV
jgi:hypothetical protein